MIGSNNILDNKVIDIKSISSTPNQPTHSLVSQLKRLSKFTINQIAEGKLEFFYWYAHAVKNNTL